MVLINTMNGTTMKSDATNMRKARKMLETNKKRRKLNVLEHILEITKFINNSSSSNNKNNSKEPTEWHSKTSQRDSKLRQQPKFPVQGNYPLNEFTVISHSSLFPPSHLGVFSCSKNTLLFFCSLVHLYKPHHVVICRIGIHCSFVPPVSITWELNAKCPLL